MAWLWSKLTLRRQLDGDEARNEQLGYPAHSWERLFGALRDAIEAGGGRVLIDRPAAALSRAPGGAGFVVRAGAGGSFRRGHDPREYEPADGDGDRHDAVVATVPSDVFLALLDDDLTGAIGSPYLDRLRATEYHAALCLLLELDRPFSPFYWTNIADTSIPFVGLVEHTNFVDPARYGGRRFLYVANYLAPGDPLLALDAAGLLAAYMPGLRAVAPEFSADWIVASWLHREPAAQPIVTVGYQIYPEDRGTNYSVRLGGDAARALLQR
jgi:protoporphyrinogen oxidase